VAAEFYVLPPEKIAQEPPKVRGASRLLVLHRDTKKLEDKRYTDAIDYLEPGDVLVLNDTKVMPARLITKFADGREREMMLTEKHARELPKTQAQVVYRGKLRAGDELYVGDEELRVLEILEGGQAIIEADRSIAAIADEYGATPLPPYIRREANQDDAQRYQTVFAHEVGSVAAPTASLNMTDELLRAIKAKGIEVVYLTLHVGRGTFLPIRSEKVNDHKMHEEYFEIPSQALQKIRAAKQMGGRVVALGTTVTRALEYAAGDILTSKTQIVHGEADIFIHPGYEFRVVDALLTNFHAPESTVIQLAAAFAGEEFLRTAYRHALKSNYRFLSYGDSMLII
jgi:S-adenosylmethionine:tRNA ribosyltransferase-isomerase